MDSSEAVKSAILARFPRVYPILDTGHLSAVGIGVLRMARELAAAGVRIAQYRHKGAFTRGIFEQAEEVREVFRSAGTCFLVNDRADIAMAIGADGVHVGQEDLEPRTVRGLVGPGMLVGYSTHNAGQLCDDRCEWADYLAIGPAFATSSKQNPDPVVGLEGVREARAIATKPLVAIGGITLANAEGVLAAGASAVSMISSVSVENLGRWMALEGRLRRR